MSPRMRSRIGLLPALGFVFYVVVANGSFVRWGRAIECLPSPLMLIKLLNNCFVQCG